MLFIYPWLVISTQTHTHSNAWRPQTNRFIRVTVKSSTFMLISVRPKWTQSTYGAQKSMKINGTWGRWNTGHSHQRLIVRWTGSTANMTFFYRMSQELRERGPFEFGRAVFLFLLVHSFRLLKCVAWDIFTIILAERIATQNFGPIEPESVRLEYVFYFQL